MGLTVDFLGIGAQKSATSWLYKNLRQYDDLWLPPRRELHYFDRSPNYPTTNQLASKYPIHRLLGKDPYNPKYIPRFLGDLIDSIREKDGKKVHWILRYYLGTYDDKWYVSLFEQGRGKIKGEITPSYSILDLEDVRRIQKLFPRLKVIFLLRNPIDRAWSQIRFRWTKGRFSDIHDVQAIKQFIDSPNHSLRGDYVRTIEIWASCFHTDQLFIGFYDDVATNPQKLLTDICMFLGANPEKVTNPVLPTEIVNASTKVEIPVEIEHYLTEKYYPELEKLSRLVGGYSNAWLEGARKIRDENRSSENSP